MDILLQAALTSFWDEFGGDLKELGQIAAGIVVYGLLVNWFYQRMDKRVMFGKKGAGGRVHVGGPGRGFLYLIMFPLISLAFFLLISATLLYLGQGKPPAEVFTIAMGIVLAVRVTAYFSESAAHDVAKMLPLGLLGVFLVTGERDTMASAVKSILEIFDHLDVVVLYFVAIVILEYILRLVYLVVQSSKAPKRPQGPAAVRRQP